MDYNNELSKIKSLVSENVWKLFSTYNVIIGGGAITSVFCNREVNDLDIYLRSEDDFFSIISEIYSGGHYLVAANMTNRSILFRDKDTHQDVQFIVYKFFKDTKELFNDYDFTINMGALNCTDETFEFHEEFFKHNSQRYLQFHEKTSYPLISLLRVQKYIEKGYSISKAQMLRILLTISKLNINSWEDIKDHCGGFYGLNMDEVFPEDKEFTIDLAIETLDEVFGDNKFKTYFTTITEEEITDKYLSNHISNRISSGNRFFKNVMTDISGNMRSCHTQSFIYKLDEIVDGGKNGIYCYKGYDVLTGIYNNYHDENLILELESIDNNIKENKENYLTSFNIDDKIQLFGQVKVIGVYTKSQFIRKFTK